MKATEQERKNRGISFIVDKIKENPKLRYRFIRSKLLVREQIVKLKEPEGSTAGEINLEFQSLFTVEDMLSSVIRRWEREKTLERIVNKLDK